MNLKYPPKINAWKTNFLLWRPIFRSELLVSGSVSSLGFLEPWIFNDFRSKVFADFCIWRHVENVLLFRRWLRTVLVSNLSNHITCSILEWINANIHMNTHDVSYAIAFVPFCLSRQMLNYQIQFAQFLPCHRNRPFVTFEPDIQQPLAVNAQFTWC